MDFQGYMEMDPHLFKSCSYLKGRAQHVSNLLGLDVSNLQRGLTAVCFPVSSHADKDLLAQMASATCPLQHRGLHSCCKPLPRGWETTCLGRLRLLEQSVFLTYSGNLVTRKHKAPWLLPEMMSGLLFSCRGSSLIKLDEGQRLLLRLFLLWSSVKR